MSGQSTVNRAAMMTAAGQVDEAHATISGIQTTLSSEVGSLRGGWQGQAAEAFYKAHDLFNKEFTDVTKTLAWIYEQLAGSRANYATTEEDSTAATNPILGML